MKQTILHDWFTSHERLLTFVNEKHNIQIVSIIAINNGNSYELFYTYKKDTSAELLERLLQAIEAGQDEGDRYKQWIGKAYIEHIRKQLNS